MSPRFLIPAGIFLVIACGTAKEDKKTEDRLNYQMTDVINGKECTTGLRKFSNFEQLCRGLRDETANKSCAQDQRKAMFKSRCAGTFKAFNVPPEQLEEKPPRLRVTVDPIQVTVRPYASHEPDLTGIIQNQDLAEGAAAKATVRGINIGENIELAFGCSPTLDAGSQQRDRLSAIPGSRVLVGKIPDDKTLMKQFSCKGSVTTESVELPRLNERIVEVPLRVTDKAVAVTTLLLTQESTLSVTCVKDAITAAAEVKVGIAILPGTILLAWTDAGDPIPVRVIKCEL